LEHGELKLENVLPTKLCGSSASHRQPTKLAESESRVVEG